MSRVRLSDSEGAEILRPSVEGFRMTICSIPLEILRVSRIPSPFIPLPLDKGKGETNFLRGAEPLLNSLDYYSKIKREETFRK